MHRAALAAAGLKDWSYQRLPVPPELFAETGRALGAAGFRGANVTIPHKEVALAIADHASDTARAIGAANTLTYADDGAIHADNTDAPGLLDAIEGRAPRDGRGARRGRQRARRRLGAADGRHARAGLEPHAGARRAPRRRGPRPPADPSAAGRPAVNCTSVGLGDPSKTFKQLPISPDAISTYPTLVDLVYRPGGTALELAARERGVTVVGGLEILVRQGAHSFAAWTGMSARPRVMRAAVLDPP